jgi:hypothetical protein
VKSKLIPFWYYKENDKSTWKYLDFKISEFCGRKIFISWIENPNFKYKEEEKIGHSRKY